MAVSQVELWGWFGLRLTGGPVSLTAVPDVGGRVMSLTLDDIEVCFSHPALHGQRLDLEAVTDVRAKKRELGWRHYGGYKTWLAPQARWTDALPFLDLDSGRYTAARKGTGVQLTSPRCRETGVQLTRTITVSPAGRITVDQAMTNRSIHEVTWGLWDVTQVGGPGKALLPVATGSRFDGGIKAYANEGRSPDVIDQYVTRDDGMAAVTCRQVEPFKYGTDSREGWILGLLDRTPDRWLAYLKLFEPVPGVTYPHESVVEVFDSGTLPYFELEVHSPMQRLAPGATYTARETWVLDWLPKTATLSTIREWIMRARQTSAGEMRRTP